MTDSKVPTLGTATLAAARRLHGVATALLVLVLIVTVSGIAIGIAIALAKHGTARTAGISVAAGSVVLALSASLPYLAAQAVARYIEFRVWSTAELD